MAKSGPSQKRLLLTQSGPSLLLPTFTQLDHQPTAFPF